MAMEGLPPEYRKEPELALAGGDDGLDAVRAILKAAPRFLAPGGTLVVEIGHNRAAVEPAFPRLPFVWLETASEPAPCSSSSARTWWARPERGNGVRSIFRMQEWAQEMAGNGQVHFPSPSLAPCCAYQENGPDPISSISAFLAENGPDPISRTGGEILVANLLAQGATHAFCVPGESFLAVLDALHDVRDRLQLVVCRQEGGAAFMAEACGKMTGRPGVAIVTRGPGASNAAIGVHTAAQDSTPLILLVGQVGGDFADREAFQEIDYRRMYGSIAKWVGADRPARADPRVRRARVPRRDVRAPRARRAGAARGHAGRARRPAPTRRGSRPRPRRPTRDRSRPRARCSRRRSVRWCWSAAAAGIADAVAALRRFAEANALPVACAFRHQDLFDNRHPNYAGDVGIGINPKLAARVRAADVLLVIGERLGETTTSGYTLLDACRRRRRR